MKDFIQFVAIMIVIFGLMAAVPVLGIVIGVGLGAWFLLNAWKEEKNAKS